MTNAIIIMTAVLLLAGLLSCEHKGLPLGILGCKSGVSLLFILAAAAQPHHQAAFGPILIAALCLCFGGDVLLALRTGTTFTLGLLSFLVGHLLYLWGFFTLSAPNLGLLLGGAPGLIISALAFCWLRPHLRQMALPVLLYVVVITSMLAAAWMVTLAEGLPLPGRLMIGLGATCFYFSDLSVARDRFVQKGYINRLIGLPLYYLGQFLLAFSLGALG